MFTVLAPYFKWIMQPLRRCALPSLNKQTHQKGLSQTKDVCWSVKVAERLLDEILRSSNLGGW